MSSMVPLAFPLSIGMYSCYCFPTIFRAVDAARESEVVGKKMPHSCSEIHKTSQVADIHLFKIFIIVQSKDRYYITLDYLTLFTCLSGAYVQTFLHYSRKRHSSDTSTMCRNSGQGKWGWWDWGQLLTQSLFKHSHLWLLWCFIPHYQSNWFFL